MKILKIFIFLIMLAFVSYLVDRFWTNKQDISYKEEQSEGEVFELCFADLGETADGEASDKYTLRVSINNQEGTVKGELKFLPKEKDKKTGMFEGTISKLDQELMGRRIEAIWDTFAEGMNTKEELHIVFGEGIANIGFGEMVEGEDGTYFYKDKENIYFGEPILSDISCIDLTEMETAEDFLNKNISVLSAVKPVLGGNWYITDYEIDTTTNTGSITYEDGHIQEESNFSYDTDENGKVKNLRFVSEGGES